MNRTTPIVCIGIRNSLQCAQSTGPNNLQSSDEENYSETSSNPNISLSDDEFVFQWKTNKAPQSRSLFNTQCFKIQNTYQSQSNDSSSSALSRCDQIQERLTKNQIIKSQSPTFRQPQNINEHFSEDKTQKSSLTQIIRNADEGLKLEQISRDNQSISEDNGQISGDIEHRYEVFKNHNCPCCRKPINKLCFHCPHTFCCESSCRRKRKQRLNKSMLHRLRVEKYNRLRNQYSLSHQAVRKMFRIDPKCFLVGSSGKVVAEDKDYQDSNGQTPSCGQEDLDSGSSDMPNHGRRSRRLRHGGKVIKYEA